MPQPAKNTITLTKFGIMIAAILAFGVFVRVGALDRMALHHDESIHALHSYNLYEGNASPCWYDPTYHGPFLYHFGALFFLLFGDNDFTARLPFVSFGVLMLYFIWRLRPWVGTSGMTACLLLAASSPVLTYFSRFARNDIYMGTMALGIVLFALEYLRSRRAGDLVWMSFFLVLMYCCKENSLMYGFTFGSFVVFYGIYYVWNSPKEEKKSSLSDIFTVRSPFVHILSLYALFTFAAFSLVFYVTHKEQFKLRSNQLRVQGGEESFSIGVLRSTWNEYVGGHWKVVPFWTIASIVGVVVLFVLFAWLYRKFRTAPEEGSLLSRLSRRYLLVLVCVLVILFVYSFLFTTMGTNPSGMKAGTVDYLLYWMGQQFNPRISGPADYYIPRLLVYEACSVFFAVLAFFFYLLSGLGWVNFCAFLVAFLGIVYTYCIVILGNSSLKDFSSYYVLFFSACIAIAIFLFNNIVKLFSCAPPELMEEKEKETQKSLEKEENRGISADGFRLFLIYWSVLSLLIYAMLEEKVPWLLTPQALPLVLLAGTFIGDVWDYLGPGVLRGVFVCVAGLFVVYEARTDIMLNLYQNDDPREIIVYTQSDHIIKSVADEMIRGAHTLGAEYLPPNPVKYLAALQGNAQWPYYWYLRHYRVMPAIGIPDKSNDYPYILIDENYEQRMKIWGEGKYAKRKLKHRVWWPYETKDRLSLQQVFPFDYGRMGAINSQSEAWKAFWKYIIYRQVWSSPGSTDVLFYARTPLIAPEPAPQVPDAYKQPPRPLQVIQMAGGVRGSDNGQFNEPRGVALSPDEKKLYVLDSRNGRIQVFDAETLQFIGVFGGPGTQPGAFEINKFDGPNGGLGVGPDGSIFATDTWQNDFGRINHYNPEGQAANPIILPPGENFYSPRGLAVSPQDGSLYVADTGNKRIVKFNPAGGFGGVIVKSDLNEPVGVAISPQGVIYVCDVAGKRIVAFNSAGQFVRQWQIFGWNSPNVEWIEPYIAIDAKGFVYVSDSTTNTIYRFDPTGQNVAQGGGEGSGLGQLNSPKGLAIDSKGFLYIADSMNHRVVKARFPG